MTAPIWMASPPEVHSALLSSGPGPGSLLAAAGAWNGLSAEYASAADELTALLASVQTGAWQGPSAESYVAAHAPYLAWLMQASASSTTMAAEHETMAAAYTAALAAMPTLPELAANHVIHGALVATNFFGINAIPIALNEFQYVQMWIQAAVTMTVYQAQADAIGVLTSLQNNPAVPPILKDFLSGISNDTLAHDPTVDNPIDDLVAQFLQNFGINWSPADGTVNGLEYDAYADPSRPMWWVVRALELSEDFQQFGVYLTQNPVLAVQYLISLELFDFPLHIAPGLSYLASQPAVWAAGIAAAVAPLGSAGGLAGLAGLTGLQSAVEPVPAPVATAPAVVPVIASSPIAAPAAAPATAPAPAPSPTATTVAGSAPAPPPAAGGPGFFPPYAAGGPGMGSGAGMGGGASSSAKRKAPEPDTAGAAAAAAAREEARARRRRRAKRRDHGDEFLDMNVDVDPDWDEPPSTTASERGGAVLGFAGTAPREEVAEAAGLTTLAHGELGGGPRAPMLPGTWDPGA
jgi:PPE-repeat protein